MQLHLHRIHRHPPCEDVSWKMMKQWKGTWYLVILLVRMWVENQTANTATRESLGHPPCEDVSWKAMVKSYLLTNLPSSSLWGCELKSMFSFNKAMVNSVILLVRMWVEKSFTSCDKSSILSSSLWGCELKKRCGIESCTGGSHPPCEDVSWKSNAKAESSKASCHPPCEDVSWKENDVKMYGTQV